MLPMRWWPEAWLTTYRCKGTNSVSCRTRLSPVWRCLKIESWLRDELRSCLPQPLRWSHVFLKEIVIGALQDLGQKLTGTEVTFQITTTGRKKNKFRVIFRQAHTRTHWYVSVGSFFVLRCFGPFDHPLFPSSLSLRRRSVLQFSSLSSKR